MQSWKESILMLFKLLNYWIVSILFDDLDRKEHWLWQINELFWKG